MLWISLKEHRSGLRTSPSNARRRRSLIPKNPLPGRCNSGRIWGGTVTSIGGNRHFDVRDLDNIRRSVSGIDGGFRWRSSAALACSFHIRFLRLTQGPLLDERCSYSLKQKPRTQR